MNYKNIIEFYDSNSDKYCSDRSARFYANLTKLICDAAAKITPKPNLIIDIGSGSGFSTRVIAERFPETNIIAVEPARSFHLRAKKRLKRKKIEFKNCRLAEADDLDADLWISNMSYHWLSGADKKNLRKLMGSESILAMAAPLKPVGTPSKRFPGNRMVVDSYREMIVKDNLVSPAKILRGSSRGKIDRGLEMLSETIVELLEEFPASDFSGELYYRGLLPALFGDRACVARGILERRSRQFKIIEYGWPVTIRLARKNRRPCT